MERAILPLGNDVVATEPIDDSTWATIGLARRELFEIAVNMVAYGQRTADGRIVFGGGVGYDRATGSAWAGGYIGQGVASANAAGRTLADLIVGADTEMTRLPWVGHRSPRWEPEPFRWLGVHVVASLARLRDSIDTRRG